MHAVVQSGGSHLVGVQVRVLLAQSEQERLRVSTQRLFGGDEVGPTDIQAHPAGIGLLRGLGRGARVALGREAEHRASPAAAAAAAAARHPARAELAAPRRNHESGRSEAHRAAEVAMLRLLYGARATRFHHMQLGHDLFVSRTHNNTQVHNKLAAVRDVTICKQREAIFLRRAGWHQGVAAHIRQLAPPAPAINTRI